MAYFQVKIDPDTVDTQVREIEPKSAIPATFSLGVMRERA
jgi:hypothetical protein